MRSRYIVRDKDTGHWKAEYNNICLAIGWLFLKEVITREYKNLEICHIGGKDGNSFRHIL